MNINKIEIKSLFGIQDVRLPLEGDVNIFIGENGLGKTTILSCIYYIISGKLEKLIDIDFSEIVVYFNNNEKEIIKKIDIVSYVNDFLEFPRSRGRVNLKNFFSSRDIKEILNIKYDKSIGREVLNKYILSISESFGLPIRIAEMEFSRFFRHIEDYSARDNGGNYNVIKELKNKLSDKISFETLYFPTYRRIEEEMKNLKIEKGEFTDELIKFGMNDVESYIEDILAEIKKLAITGFTQMTGVLITQYLNGEVKPIKNKIDVNKISIALARIGDKIKNEDRENILNLVKGDKIFDEQNAYLHNLLSNLISSYEEQSKYDDRVKKFVETCNQYLVDKEFIYDESNVELKIVRKLERNEDTIHLSKLSSGEKQIVSLFSRLYLGKNENFNILFDEPELSLSLKWQEMLLPDIMNSGVVEKMIVVTHSPFIFNNKYDEVARDMKVFVSETR